MNCQVEIALRIAEKAHDGQVDKAGKKYIDHPISVFNFTEWNYKIRTAALLHDVLEDSDYTADDLLAEGIEPDIVDAVKLLTHGENEPYFDYVRRVKGNPISKAVKLADLRHNMDISRLENPCSDDFERIKKYEEAVKILIEE